MRGREEEEEECTSSACRLAISEGHHERSEQAGASIMNGVFSLPEEGEEGDAGTVQDHRRGPATRQEREREALSHTLNKKKRVSQAFSCLCCRHSSSSGRGIVVSRERKVCNSTCYIITMIQASRKEG